MFMAYPLPTRRAEHVVSLGPRDTRRRESTSVVAEITDPLLSIMHLSSGLPSDEYRGMVASGDARAEGP
jgi:hypothetical protein